MHVYVGMCAHTYVYIHIAVCVQSHCVAWSVWYEVSSVCRTGTTTAPARH